MEKFHEILLNVWKEACRHIEIGESAATIAEMLLERMPNLQVLVRQLDPQRSCLETVAVGFSGPEHPVRESRRELSAAQMRELLAWCRRGEVSYWPADTPKEGCYELIVPPGIEGETLAGPLGGKRSPTGVLVLVSASGRRYEPRHRRMMGILLEPFTVALENDGRLREMTALREAAEADKRSLLTRLGRKQLADRIVGVESGLHSVMERVELVARSDVPVLIFGETGTGKELVARAIHRRSPRASGPVIRVNCGAIPPELIDSQLFGHERGAFTGAVEERKGWFECADGGTLFLDEIGELPLAAQVRLLRILQDGWMERVGGHRPIRVDVRIVAATHRDLAAMVAESKFREDLWYRIAVFPILLPPLRERREDIPLLARHFAERAANRFGLPQLMPTEEDVRLLIDYPWPGNVRELGTVMDRAAILGDGIRLEVAKALGITPPQRVKGGGRETPRGAREESSSETLLPLEEAMRRHIEKALTLTKGRIEGASGTARALKINPHTLRARMRKLGIDWSQYRGQ